VVKNFGKALCTFFEVPVICNVAFDVTGLGYNNAFNVPVGFAGKSLATAPAANFHDLVIHFSRIQFPSTLRSISC
jgi:hypothetical protein